MKLPRIRQEHMFGALIGVISGYYIFNDMMKDFAANQYGPNGKTPYIPPKSIDNNEKK